MANKLTSREENYSDWYNELVVKADLAEHSDVRGCMIIKPYGFGIWERMKDDLDRRFKETKRGPTFVVFFDKGFDWYENICKSINLFLV